MAIFYEVLQLELAVSCILFLFGIGANGIVEAVIRFRDYLDYRKDKKKDDHESEKNH